MIGTVAGSSTAMLQKLVFGTVVATKWLHVIISYINYSKRTKEVWLCNTNMSFSLAVPITLSVKGISTVPGAFLGELELHNYKLLHLYCHYLDQKRLKQGLYHHLPHL
jgi:hypothetical protein